MRPLIGITGRRLSCSIVSTQSSTFSTPTFDFFYSDYARCVFEAGGIPVHLPFEAGTAEIMDRLDGLILTGGQDVHPNRWGGDDSALPDDDPRFVPLAIDEERDEYELTLTGAAVDRNLPLLAICRGHQLLNVAFGGTLIDDLPMSEVEHMSASSPPQSDDHRLELAADSLVGRIYGRTVRVNSWHHQAVDALGSGLVVGARAPDGVIESIEVPGVAVLGVQWHPEWRPTLDPVFKWLIEAGECRAD
jgi:putative glutamine amidotransferase